MNPIRYQTAQDKLITDFLKLDVTTPLKTLIDNSFFDTLGQTMYGWSLKSILVSDASNSLNYNLGLHNTIVWYHPRQQDAPNRVFNQRVWNYAI